MIVRFVFAAAFFAVGTRPEFLDAERALWIFVAAGFAAIAGGPE